MFEVWLITRGMKIVFLTINSKGKRYPFLCFCYILSRVFLCFYIWKHVSRMQMQLVFNSYVWYIYWTSYSIELLIEFIVCETIASFCNRDFLPQRFLGSILHPPSWLLRSCPLLIVSVLLYTKQETIHNEGSEIQLSSNKWCYIVSSLTHPSAPGLYHQVIT